MEQNSSNAMKRIIFVALTLVLMVGCKPETIEIERPLYPTEGAINARFSVSDSITVVFSMGNLQYQASSKTFRFANNQYDVVGVDNRNIDTMYTGWIDLFGWATSGYNGNEPYSTNDTNEYYGPYGVDICHTQYDWGEHNPIMNAGNQAGQWRVLESREWNYLIYLREGASLRRGLATIENVGPQGSSVCGFVLLPDKWELPAGLEFHVGSKNGFATNLFSAGDWNQMQAAGAVFLPAAGYRDKRQVSLINEYGCYWTSTYYTDATAEELYFLPSGFSMSTAARANGHSVRLVQNK